MGVVGGEHEQLRCRLLDHPTHRLPGKGRELEVSAHIVGRLVLEPPKRLFGTTERTLAVVQMADPGHDPPGALLDAPASQLGETIEQTVEDERAEEQLG